MLEHVYLIPLIPLAASLVILFAGKEGAGGYDYKEIQRKRLIDYRRTHEAVVPVDYPTNLPRARQLGYKAKQGIAIARVRIRRGSGLHRRPVKGRRPKRMGVQKLTRRLSIQSMAEQRANRRYPNCEVLNSYKIGQDGQHHYFEVILVNPSEPAIASDKSFAWLAHGSHANRAFRGKTSAGKKSRGLRKKGRGAEKIRPSQRAHSRKAK